jgi:hypothetical protein
MFNIQLLSADVFERVTGTAPPPSPVTAESYAAAGLPFFEIQGEQGQGVQGLFSDIKSIGQIDERVGFRGVDQLIADVKAWGIETAF